MNNAALTDIKNLIDQEFDDLELEDFLDFFSEIRDYGQKLANLAQTRINQRVEELVDSFGGADCTMRQNKGE